MMTPPFQKQLVRSRYYYIPEAPLRYFNDAGESDRGSYFIPKKMPTSEFVYPKNSLLFFIIFKKYHTSIKLLIRPEQFNFLFFEHLGQKLKIGGGKKK